MAKRLTNIRPVGRFKEVATGKEVNVKQGRNASRSTNHLYYLYMGKRIFIPDFEFYGDGWESVS